MEYILNINMHEWCNFLNMWVNDIEEEKEACPHYECDNCEFCEIIK